ncbi:response regulator [Marinoscillum furvescens]|uniref:Hpt domain-containing protein n=1 Tax=Marinoscillum furvescens DSM 4134 TaxID=1122208 RepID=A0A3D9L2V4_MARFU|nr:response regulator [Marinoscillum furvescens]RED99446.1 Hpt domain-containing protein [Marinoscillum furvescens DSM 4134]
MVQILLLDDSQVALFTLQVMLNKLRQGLKIHTCLTYDAALKVVKNYEVDIAFLDLQIPDKNGADFVHLLNQSPEYAEIKKVIITGTSESSLLKASLEQHVDGYLHKGLSIQELEEVLESLLASKLGIDLEAVKVNYGDAFREVFKAYKEENDSSFGLLQKAVEQKAYADAHQLFHKMKGGFKFIMHEAMSNLANELELQAQEGKLYTEKVKEFEAAYKALSDKILFI